jgi:hypothetical protein
VKGADAGRIDAVVVGEKDLHGGDSRVEIRDSESKVG